MLNYLLFIKQKGFVTDQFLQRGGGCSIYEFNNTFLRLQNFS